MQEDRDTAGLDDRTATLRLRSPAGVIEALIRWPIGPSDGGGVLVAFADDAARRPVTAALAELADRRDLIVICADAAGDLGRLLFVLGWVADHAQELRADARPLGAAMCSSPPLTTTIRKDLSSMRRITAGLFITLDGVTEAPETWQPAFMNEEVGAALGASMASADTILLGRRTYAEWAVYWPNATDNPFAEQINGAPKLVASTTLDSVEWQNSQLLEGDVVEALRSHQQQPGRDIAINGSTTLLQSLLRAGIVDELNLLVHPVVAGRGRRLFDDVGQLSLRLTGATPFSNGVVSMSYEPIR